MNDISKINSTLKQIAEGQLGDMAHRAEQDHEVQMARADLYKLAKYAIKLHEMLKNVSEAQGLEGWQQAKITKAADYISSVYHNLDYEMSGMDVGSDMQTVEINPEFEDVDVTEGMKEKIKGALRRQREKEHWAQSRTDVAGGKAADAYAAGDERKGDRYMDWRKKAQKKLGIGPMEAKAKPDYLDLDKDGDTKEPMKKAAQDAKKKTNESRFSDWGKK